MNKLFRIYFSPESDPGSSEPKSKIIPENSLASLASAEGSIIDDNENSDKKKTTKSNSKKK